MIRGTPGYAEKRLQLASDRSRHTDERSGNGDKARPSPKPSPVYNIKAHFFIAFSLLNALGLLCSVTVTAFALAAMRQAEHLTGWKEAITVMVASLLAFYCAMIFGVLCRDIARYMYGIALNTYNSYWTAQAHRPEARGLRSLCVWAGVGLGFSLFPLFLYWVPRQTGGSLQRKFMCLMTGLFILFLTGSVCGLVKRIFRPKGSPPDTIVPNRIERLIAMPPAGQVLMWNAAVTLAALVAGLLDFVAFRLEMTQIPGLVAIGILWTAIFMAIIGTLAIRTLQPTRKNMPPFPI